MAQATTMVRTYKLNLQKKRNEIEITQIKIKCEKLSKDEVWMSAKESETELSENGQERVYVHCVLL